MEDGGQLTMVDLEQWWTMDTGGQWWTFDNGEHCTMVNNGQ